ncbi:phosphoglycerate mutase-like protein AT74H [Abrus precatorius]|uniref:Phosphoglycerate mutase-like protein AT74H n=1 Tax=Abrus precatorius TaxID=3816 RepID=A0A8B8LZJ3_ABRPR|nr:phosphoglycerate mutase-like protein AT74H [Abrus precatorius]
MGMAVLPLPYYPSLPSSQQKPLQTKPNSKSNTNTSLIVQCCHNQTEPIKLNSNGHARFPEKNPLINSAPSTPFVPPRPRRIILVRHGESQGNVDESVYTRIPDPKIALTDKGKAQAEECGHRIKKMIEKDGDENWQIYFYVSPYRRTLETLQSLARPFERSRIAGFREEPRIREQDFGNFQNREKMRVEKALRKLYGRFFYRFPDGESAADVYDRITGFRETLRTDINIGRYQAPGKRRTEMNLVIVSHGLTLRVFLMRWYKWTVQQFEGLTNLGNGDMLVMEKGYGGRYSLLAHHQEEELRRFGLTDEMLIDQEWQKFASPADLNYDCPMVNSFFPHLNEATSKCEQGG